MPATERSGFRWLVAELRFGLVFEFLDNLKELPGPPAQNANGARKMQ
jgi:hypothetical protein